MPGTAMALHAYDGTQSPYVSSEFTNPEAGLKLYIDVTSITAGQTVTPRLLAYDQAGTAYFYGPSLPVISSAGQYLYCVMPGATTTGGGFASGAAVALPAPEQWALQLTFSDTTGSKPATLSASFEEVGG